MPCVTNRASSSLGFVARTPLKTHLVGRTPQKGEKIVLVAVGAKPEDYRHAVPAA